ncbi:MAG TPA: YdcF family protein [Terriglobales bacterium]
MLKRTLDLLILGILAIFLFRHAASYLVVNDPKPADLILVLGGGNNDLRYWNGVRLMQEGYAPRLMLDVFARGQTFGHLDIDLAKELLERTSPGRSVICPLSENSTYDEARYLAHCLERSDVKSVLVVTSAYHTRRSLSILQHRLPQYQFSTYAAPDPYFFGQRWWTHREWAKTTLAEWERYLWWLLVDRWRSGLVVH